MVLILSSSILEQQLAMQYQESTIAFLDYLTHNCQTNFLMYPTDEHEIINVTKNLKSSTSEGFDNISMKIIKTTVHQVAMPLAHIFNQSSADF